MTSPDCPTGQHCWPEAVIAQLLFDSGHLVIRTTEQRVQSWGQHSVMIPNTVTVPMMKQNQQMCPLFSFYISSWKLKNAMESKVEKARVHPLIPDPGSHNLLRRPAFSCSIWSAEFTEQLKTAQIRDRLNEYMGSFWRPREPGLALSSSSFSPELSLSLANFTKC